MTKQLAVIWVGGPPPFSGRSQPFHDVHGTENVSIQLVNRCLDPGSRGPSCMQQGVQLACDKTAIHGAFVCTAGWSCHALVVLSGG